MGETVASEVGETYFRLTETLREHIFLLILAWLFIAQQLLYPYVPCNILSR